MQKKYYTSCPFCNANLDPGERCDCREKRPQSRMVFTARLRTQRDGQMVLREVMEGGTYVGT
mgnify:CR=1 FL=1